MNDKKLNKRLSEYYNDKRLPKDTLARLTRMVEFEAVTPSCPSVGLKERCRALFSGFGLGPVPKLVTAFSCLIVVSVITWHIAVRQNDLNRGFPMAVAREITMNHQKNLAPEFRDMTVLVLGRTMAKLDFTPVPPDIVDGLKMKFLGARYCSIQGNIAAQMKFEAPSGLLYTLYQTRLVEELSIIKESHIELDGLQVKLWQEKGLFMGIAGPGNPPLF